MSEKIKSVVFEYVELFYASSSYILLKVLLELGWIFLLMQTVITKVCFCRSFLVTPTVNQSIPNVNVLMISRELQSVFSENFTFCP